MYTINIETAFALREITFTDAETAYTMREEYISALESEGISGRVSFYVNGRLTFTAHIH